MSVILFIVYCIQNQVNQKNYVGKTCVPIEKRWQAHKNNAKHGSNLAFHNAIRKYGENVFSINILAENLSDEEASEMEKQKIVELSSHVSTGKGYNMTWGGDGTGSGEQHPSYGKPVPQERRDKIAASRVGEKNPSHKAAGPDHWNRGIIRSEETRAKLREANLKNPPPSRKGVTLSEETRAKIREARARQAPLTEEAKKRISDKLKGRKPSPNAIAASRKALEGYTHSEETRAKISEANRGRVSNRKGKHHTEESNAKNRAAHLGKKVSLETRIKMSISQRARAVREKLQNVD